MKYRLLCTDCSSEFSAEEVEYLCPLCEKKQVPDESPRGVLRCEYDYKAAKKRICLDTPRCSSYLDQRKYLPLLPIDSLKSLPPLRIGHTPLDDVKRLRQKLGLKNLYVKNDTCLPTGSYKDRASSIVVAKASELGKAVVTTASTGNAATALAGMCASVGMKSVIFVPASAPRAKLVQIAAFGGKLIPIDGTYDDAFALSVEAARYFGWYNRNTAYNPYTVEGKKTAAFEIWEQLERQVPDKVFIPTGEGVILAGIYKGFYDLKQLGAVAKLPQIICVQAAGSAAIIDAFEKDLDGVKSLACADTIADSISVLKPSNGRWALKILKETNGFGVKVTDDEILSASVLLASHSGIFAEPAGAAALAGLVKALKNGLVKNDETVVVLATGNGLKDVEAIYNSISIPEAIEPALDAVKDVLK